ncbi:DUF1800 domain-containing protein [Mucilaginibacter calamicampi]|uniref:DUF1800 domain-containing protein n=1 Tax=Mucilaginibacter calamicampi TaxID=1302352 RepID=A0ABW2YT02_9SPHI
MKTAVKYSTFLFLAVVIVFSSAFIFMPGADLQAPVFPYKKAGLTQRQAAAHLLNRFTYGATPGEVDKVVKMGIEKWFMQQLDGNLPNDSLNQILDKYDALKLSNTQIVAQYPKNAVVLRMAVRDDVVDKDSVKTDRKEYQQVLQNYMQQHGLKPEQELLRQLFNQKVLRAAYSNNQLHEVLTDFWFNHFNVSLTKNQSAQFIANYERDAIRPNVTGNFDALLLATAKSPAMLYYLDNFNSTGTNVQRPRALIRNAANNKPAKKAQGLNENYAREVMELHTLGVDGGYTQQDVTQAARVLTGWTVFPMGAYGNADAVQKLVDNIGEKGLKQRGFVHDGDFLFTPNRHDNDEKIVLGKKFDEGGGYQEGVELLELLAHHPSTAKFITRKLAIRFVNDDPAQSLLDKMAKTFTQTNGNIRQVLIAMVSSPDFWSAKALRQKTKSPFELVISSARALNARIDQPVQLYNWANKMGQRMYAYQAPTGFPDRSQYWINSGALLNRMNFGLAMATGRVPGVKVNLAALNNNHEPESPEAALATYSKLLMPERDLSATIKQLTPMLSEKELVNKVEAAAAKVPQAGKGDDMMMEMNDAPKKNAKKSVARTKTNGNNSMLAQVVGVILGSPEFQRR